MAAGRSELMTARNADEGKSRSAPHPRPARQQAKPKKGANDPRPLPAVFTRRAANGTRKKQQGRLPSR